MQSLAIRLIIAAAVLASALFAGWRLGDHLVRGEWAAANLAAERAEAERRDKNRDRAVVNAAAFEAQRQKITANQAEVSNDLRKSLAAASCPVGAASTPLADLPVPAAVVDSLRRAGADPTDH